jgi:hypothetical protein
MSSHDIKKALKDSGLTIPVGGVPLNATEGETPIAQCKLGECMFVCRVGCWGPCDTSCMLGCSPGCFGLTTF